MSISMQRVSWAAQVAGALVLVSWALGCGGQGPDGGSNWDKINPFNKPFARSQSPDDEDDSNTLETTVDTPLIGDYTTISGLNYITLQGVGLVVGLDGTGGDPPPSHYREILLQEMRRRQVPDPNQILASPNTALVVVRAYLPPLVAKGDHFDVFVRVPGEGDETSSLNGGWLMETYLSEHALVPGRGTLKGRDFAKAGGPILVSPTEGDEGELAGVLLRGKVLGGGVSLTERHLSMYLRNDFASFRNATRIADRVGTRFFRYNEYGIREPLAEAKTHQRVEFNLQPRYKDNYPRYLQVIRNIAFRETDVARRVRMEKLGQKLNNPAEAERAALQLEAIGLDAIPTLREALQNPDIEVRFHAATSLTYLGESDGIEHLAEVARDEPAFRVFALAALAAAEDASAHIELRSLMHGDSAETRYGAFRSLSVLDENDPFIQGEPMPNAEEPQFMLHVLETQGDPMVHLTNRKKAEVVLFGADQQFKTPLALRAGRHILVTAAPGSPTVTVSRYEAGQPDRKEHIPNRIADVVRTLAEFEASYPDVLQLLVQADQQQNLPGRLAVDALPKSGRIYYRNENGQKKKAHVGRSGLLPNLFDETGDPSVPPSQDEPAPEEPEIPTEDGVASVTDVREDSAPADATPETPQTDLLRDERKWYDPRRLLVRPSVGTVTDDE